VSGAAWAALSGVGFGLFQALNAKALRGLGSVYASTFLQLVVAGVVLAAATVATEDLGALGGISAWGIIAFALAGMIHFFVGWTTLNLSQARIGAARTSPLLSTTPLFGLAFGAALASQVPGPLVAVGIALTIGGAYLVADPGGGQRARLRDSTFAVATAAAWSLSAIFTLEGLEELDSPLLGVTIGVVAAALAYGAPLVLSPRSFRLSAGARDALALKLAAGVVVALATWCRWLALDGADVAVVLALALVSVPLVLLLAPLISGRHIEVVTAKIWGGAALVMLGSLLLIVLN
jgi:drug/metabolite transporter (DMT)-like permease